MALAAALALALGNAPAVAAQPADPLTLEVRAGFDGYVQADTWVPVTVTAANAGPDVDGELRVTVEALAGGRVVYTRPLDLPRGSRKQVALYPADLPTFSGSLTVELVRGGRVLASQEQRVQFVPATTLLVGVWASSPAGAAGIGQVTPSSGETRVALLGPADLPAVSRGWSALDVLVIADVDTGVLSDSQRQALRDWVTGGGRLIIVGGPGFQRTLAGLRDVTPLIADSTANVPVDALAAAAGAPLSVQAPPAIAAVGDLAPGARVRVRSGETPLLVGSDLGDGRVEFLAVDPALEPLRSWGAAADLWHLVLGAGRARPGWAYGFNSTQWDAARQAAAAIPGVRLPSVLALCGFLGLYTALIGPANYLILARLRRRELAWLTIPVLVILFSVIAYVTGFQLRGSQVIVHRLAVIESWPGQDRARAHALIGVWSPRRARYDIELAPGFLARPVPAGLGGGLAAVGDTIIETGDPSSLRRVQVDVGSVQTFVAEGYIDDAPRIEGSLNFTPTQTGFDITGTVANHNDFDLHRVTLMVAGSAVEIGDLPAGSVAPVSVALSGGQATPSPGPPLDPFPGTAGYYYPYFYDPLVIDITGIGDCYATPASQRQCNLVLSMLNSSARGAGAVLFAWADHAAPDIQVLNAASRSEDLALIIANLGLPAFESPARMSAIEPGLMTWFLREPLSAGYFTSPYDFYAAAGEPVVLRFEPLIPVQLPDIRQLVIHLETYYNPDPGIPVPQVSARNITTGQWEVLDGVGWGDTAIDEAARFVDAAGGVDLALRPGPQGDVSISRFDITLLGQ